MVWDCIPLPSDPTAQEFYTKIQQTTLTTNHVRHKSPYIYDILCILQGILEVKTRKMGNSWVCDPLKTHTQKEHNKNMWLKQIHKILHRCQCSTESYIRHHPMAQDTQGGIRSKERRSVTNEMRWIPIIQVSQTNTYSIRETIRNQQNQAIVSTREETQKSVTSLNNCYKTQTRQYVNSKQRASGMYATYRC